MQRSIDVSSTSRNNDKLLSGRADLLVAKRPSVSSLPKAAGIKGGATDLGRRYQSVKSKYDRLPSVHHNNQSMDGHLLTSNMGGGVEHRRSRQNNVEFGDMIQAMRKKTLKGTEIKDSLSHLVSKKSLMKMVRDDVRSRLRPSATDLLDEEEAERTKQKQAFEKRVQEQFQAMQKSSKINRLIQDSFASIAQDYETSSAQKGALEQDKARRRINSDFYKFEHQKKDNLTALYMRQAQATDATRLESILEPKWYDNPMNYRMISKISPKGRDRVNRLLNDRN